MLRFCPGGFLSKEVVVAGIRQAASAKNR